MNAIPSLGFDELKKECDAHLIKAKVGLLAGKNAYFLSTILYGLKTVYTDEIPTLAVNGVILKINPAFFLSLSHNLRISALAHESLHVAMMHVLKERIGNRNFKRWNIAADHAINISLSNSGYEIGNGWLCDRAYEDMSTEAIYDRLPDDAEESELGSDIEMAEVDGDGQLPSAQITEIITRAMTTQKMFDGSGIGELPGEFLRNYEELTNPKVPWGTLLRKYMYGFSKRDYSFRKPNRRYLPHLYIPTLYSESIFRLTIAIDVSGSVTEEMYNNFISEIVHLREYLKPEYTDIINWDTSIHSVHTLTLSESMDDVELEGGGGTNITPVIEWGNDNHPTVMVILTDGDFYPSKVDPEFPIVWVIYDNDSFTSPFGHITNIDI